MTVPTQRLTREESRAQTRDRLLTAATALFAEKGVNGAPVEQIAERAGFSRGAFYSNFADKQELVLALLEQRTRREYEEVKELGSAGDTFAARMDALRAWHRERAQHLQSWLMLRTELWLYALRTDDRNLRDGLADRERFARNALAGGIAQAFTQAGVQPPADLNQLALIVHALEDGLLIQRLICPDDTTDEGVVDAVDLLIRSWITLARDQNTSAPPHRH
ncbi:MAG: TetR/AcrR family transcriptional regulator [Thermomicrobiales bacterium]